MFGDLKVDFRVIDDFSARQAAFVSGSTDLTIGTIDSFAFDLAKGIPGTVILVLDQSFGADGIVVSPSIKETSDLRGRKVAYTRGSPAHFFLVNVLRDAKLTVNDIQSVQVDNPDVAAQAFIAGSVDAAVTWEPHISEIVNSGKGRLMESTRTRPGLIVDVMTASNEVIAQRPDDLTKFVRGWLAAVARIEGESPKEWAAMAKGLNLPESDLRKMAGGLHFADLEMNREYLIGSAPKAATVFENAVAIWRGGGLIDREAALAPAFTQRFLPQP